MSSPVELSDLDPIPTGQVLDNDDLLVRRGLTDYRATAGQVRTLNLPGFDPLAGGGPVGSDIMLVNRGGVNYQTPFSSIGLVKGTVCYFYQATAPIGWTIVPNTGDMLLGVATPIITSPIAYPAKPYFGVLGGNQAGTWQQTDVTLTINQIPSHTHNVQGSSDNTSGVGSQYARYGKSDHAREDIVSKTTGGSQPHNHGNTWRPLANVGILAVKNN